MFYKISCSFIALLAFTLSLSSHASCPAEPLAQATSGYGADGPLSYSELSFSNPASRKMDVHVFYPNDQQPAATVFFSHGFGSTNPDAYDATIKHLNSLGYTVVFAAYPTLAISHARRYDILWAGFRAAANRYPQYIDTSRVAFFGHSFGGGATPKMTLDASAKGWGANGLAMYIMAPWYFREVSDLVLANFPSHANAVVMVTQNDSINDHEMAIEFYHNVGPAEENKAYYLLAADTEGECSLQADHATYTDNGEDFGSYGELDGLDYWNWYHMDAFLDYTFTGNSTAQTIALGGGSSAQTYWGTWYTGRDYKRITVPTNPLPSNDSSFYSFPCDSSNNPRREHCGVRAE